MVPIRGEWTRFRDTSDQLEHYRLWGLIPPKSRQLRPIMVVDGRGNAPQPCSVVGYQGQNWAVIELKDGCHAIYGEYLADMQPSIRQRLDYGMCFADVLEKYVVIDIETTGLNHENDRIIEIAAATYEYGKKISDFQSFVNPGRIIPKDIVNLTGITQDDVDGAPSIEDIEGDFLRYIGYYPLVGHNASFFDVPFLSAQLSRPIDNLVVDTLPIARNTFPMLRNHKLEYLNKILRLESAGAHRALNDVETTNALLWACLAPEKYEMTINSEILDERLPGGQKKQNSIKPSNVSKKPAYNRKFEKIDIKSISPSCNCSGSTGPLCGKSIVFTGTLSIPREEAMQLAVDAGAVLKTSVSSKTGYLVVGKQDVTIVGMDGISSKEATARKLNDEGKAKIQILSEEEFLSLVKKDGALV